MAFSELGRTLQKNSRNCCGCLWRPGLEAGYNLWHLLGFLKLESNRWLEVTQTQGTVRKTSLTTAVFHHHCSRCSCEHSGSWRCQWGVIWNYLQHSAWGLGPFKDVCTIGAKAPDRWPPPLSALAHRQGYPGAWAPAIFSWSFTNWLLLLPQDEGAPGWTAPDPWHVQEQLGTGQQNYRQIWLCRRLLGVVRKMPKVCGHWC